jgi:hypothetical protein
LRKLTSSGRRFALRRGQTKTGSAYRSLSLFKFLRLIVICLLSPCRLTIPSRDDIVASPIRDGAPADGITSGYYSGHTPQQSAAGAGRRPSSPVIDDPSADLERELAGTHIGRK